MIRSMTRSTLLTSEWYKSLLAGNEAILPFVGAGYVAGGRGADSPFTYATIHKFSFADDTRSTLATGLNIAKKEFAGMSNAKVASYFGGGFDAGETARLTTVTKHPYADDSRSTLGTGLSMGRSQLAAFGDSGVAGYFAGGDGTSGNAQTIVDKFAFPADTRTTLGTGLSGTRSRLSGMSNSGTAGYTGGGGNSGLTTVDKFAFPADTRTTLATGLSAARSFTGAMADSSVAGYFGGGFTTTVVSTVDKFAFPGDTRTTLGTGLSTVRFRLAGLANSGTAGYFAGGDALSNNTNGSTTVDKFAFPSDTRTTLAVGLQRRAGSHAAAANENI